MNISPTPPYKREFGGFRDPPYNIQLLLRVEEKAETKWGNTSCTFVLGESWRVRDFYLLFFHGRLACFFFSPFKNLSMQQVGLSTSSLFSCSPLLLSLFSVLVYVLVKKKSESIWHSSTTNQWPIYHCFTDIYAPLLKKSEKVAYNLHYLYSLPRSGYLWFFCCRTTLFFSVLLF